jgi:hypothetical protein
MTAISTKSMMAMANVKRPATAPTTKPAK